MSQPESIPAGAGWLPACEEPGNAPLWTDGRCFPAVWRELLRFVAGGIAASATAELARMRLEDGWEVHPEPESDPDVDQAIGAKLHIGLRLVTVLAAARHVWVNPALVAALPDWPNDQSALSYGLAATLPDSPLFLDFEDDDGAPAAWPEPTWPLDFHLRGAVCWTADGVLSIVPVGSVGGRNPFGGTDYEPWARIVFAPGDGPYPDPGPGDLVVRGDGEMGAWVDLDSESLCAHRVAIALNLALRTLRLLWLVERAGAQLVDAILPRPERRRAARAGKQISAVFDRLPRLERPDDFAEDDDASFDAPCPIPNTHVRLEQAHALWHEALDAYHDEAEFLRKLNPLIESLRSTTMVLQKEINPLGDEIARWYIGWQQRMKDDPKMKWVKDRRDEVVHEGHIEKHSKARVMIVGPQISGRAVDIDVDPSVSAHDLVRQMQLGGLDRRVREDGMLVVERRWTVEPFEDAELLDVLAHCFGVLAHIVSEAHERLSGDMVACEVNEDAMHAIDLDLLARTGRPPCMWAGREARTSRRDLESGAPTAVYLHTSHADPANVDEVIKRYGHPEVALPEPGGAAREIAETLHRQARQIFAVDGYHQSIAWLLRHGEIVRQTGVDAGSRRERYLMLERLGEDAALLAADAVVVTGEVWKATVVAEDDPRAELRATEREDRGEALVTHMVVRDGSAEVWSSEISRDHGKVMLGAVKVSHATVLPVFEPLRQRWLAGGR